MGLLIRITCYHYNVIQYSSLSCLPLQCQPTDLNKCPAFNCFYNKILARGQGFIAISAARLRTSLVQVSVQPQTELSTEKRQKYQMLVPEWFAVINSLSRSDGQTLGVALDEIQILAGPMEHLKAGVEFEQETLARPVKMIRHVQRTRRQSTKNIIVRVLDDD